MNSSTPPAAGPPSQETRILITGTAGFIGANAVDYYLARGFKVLGTDKREPRQAPPAASKFVQCDLLDKAGLISVFSGFDPHYVLHLGARTDVFEKESIRGYAANIDGVANTLAAANACPSLRRIIMTSSRLVCPVGYIPKHDEDFCPPNFYGASKVETEKITKSTPLKAEWVIIRPVGIWGPGFLVPSYRDFFEQIRKGRYFHIKGQSPKKTFGYVKNVLYQTDKIFQAPGAAVSGKIFYISDYEPVDLQTWANLIAREFGNRPIPTAPYGVLNVAAKTGDVLRKLGWENVPLNSIRLRNLVADAVHDLSPLEAVAGPVPYTLEAATRETVAWLKANP